MRATAWVSACAGAASGPRVGAARGTARWPACRAAALSSKSDGLPLGQGRRSGGSLLAALPGIAATATLHGLPPACRCLAERAPGRGALPHRRHSARPPPHRRRTQVRDRGCRHKCHPQGLWQRQRQHGTLGHGCMPQHRTCQRGARTSPLAPRPRPCTQRQATDARHQSPVADPGPGHLRWVPGRAALLGHAS